MRAFGLHASEWDRRRIGLGVLLSLLYVSGLFAAIEIARTNSLPPFWPGNGFLAAIVLLLGRRLRWACLATCGAVAFFIFWRRAGNWDVAAIRTAINLCEGVACGFLARHALGPRRLLRTAAGFLRLQLLAVLPAAALNAAMRAAGAWFLTGAAVGPVWRGQFLFHVLGLATVLPATLLMLQTEKRERPRSWLEAVLFLAALGAGTYFVFINGQFPVSFLVCPVLMLAGLRLGPRGAVCGVIVVGLVCAPGAITGGGAFSLHPQWSLAERVFIYQGVILTILFGVSLTSFMVFEQGRLRRLLVRRAAAARSARHRAIAASRAKTEFLATMSHEIRTPMNSILGFTQLMLHDPAVSGLSRERLKIIADASGSLMTVLNDILDFSKVEAGQIELCPAPVDMAGAAAAAIEILREAAAAKGLGLRLEVEGVEGMFLVDGQRLQQVLLNLLNNAVKFTDSGHVLLRLAPAPGRAALRFEVSDSGIGIAEEALGRLFNRFTQADSSTTRQYGGSGLGLAICKGLVERMGGRIGADSRLGFGSTFWFELPEKRADAAGHSAPPADQGPQRIGGRVLLVDDHPMNRLLGETLLGVLGCTVDLAASGEEAVQAAREQAYDVILMDVHMPGMDGLAATRAILEGRRGGGPPLIIAMSADVMPQNLARCRQAGMVDHVAKPVHLPQMQAVLQRWMGHRQTRPAA